MQISNILYGRWTHYIYKLNKCISLFLHNNNISMTKLVEKHSRRKKHATQKFSIDTIMFHLQIASTNASATTFCRLFCSGTFWRPKKVADLLASFWCLFDILLEDKKRFATFCRPFPEKRTAKSQRSNFGRQMVALEKRRQKVVALAFSFTILALHFLSTNHPMLAANQRKKEVC